MIAGSDHQDIGLEEDRSVALVREA
jgi:hypothetical protein